MIKDRITPLLGVNIDHVATLRQNRGTPYPEPLQAAALALQAGADYITVHLREDRRHIQDRDVELLLQSVPRLNLEMANTPAMLELADRWQPADICLVPERREELTTEGGLDVRRELAAIGRACERLAAGGMRVSLFIDPEPDQIDAAVDAGAPAIELHTGRYCEVHGEAREQAFDRLVQAVDHARTKGLVVNAGHGLHYHNVYAVAQIDGIAELNIGHAIVARALFTGFERAVADMRAAMAGN